MIKRTITKDVIRFATIMKRTAFLLWLFLFVTDTTAQVFEPPVIIDPPNPLVGDNIRVGVFKTFFPPCLLLPWKNLDGETHLFDFDNSLPGFEENHIDLIVVALPQPLCVPFPVSPAPREFYEIGILEEGDYSLQTGWIDPSTSFPLPPNIIPFAYGEILTFSVTKPVVIHTFSSKGLVLFMSLILALTLFFLNKKENFIFRR